MLGRVTVIIPFFQRSAGILPRAVASILDQRLHADVRITILIVDDASPIDPEAEVGAITLPPHVRLEILRRPNGGPAAARNTGLDQAPDDCDVIALLDSDDAWTPDHLQRGLDALAAGADAYFDDHMTLGDGGSYFATLRQGDEPMVCGLPRSIVGDRGPLAAPSAGRALYAFAPGEAVVALCGRYLAHTSTIIYRRDGLAGLRFDDRLRAAGEDYHFSFLLALGAGTMAYSDAVGSTGPSGVQGNSAPGVRGSLSGRFERI